MLLIVAKGSSACLTFNGIYRQRLRFWSRSAERAPAVVGHRVCSRERQGGVVGPARLIAADRSRARLFNIAGRQVKEAISALGPTWDPLAEYHS